MVIRFLSCGIDGMYIPVIGCDSSGVSASLLFAIEFLEIFHKNQDKMCIETLFEHPESAFYDMNTPPTSTNNDSKVAHDPSIGRGFLHGFTPR